MEKKGVEYEVRGCGRRGRRGRCRRCGSEEGVGCGVVGKVNVSVSRVLGRGKFLISSARMVLTDVTGKGAACRGANIIRGAVRQVS